MASKKEPKYTPGMSGQHFFENQVDASDVFEEPLVIRLPSDIEKLKAMCELCQIEEEGWCCPEHCCDVSFKLINQINRFINIVGYMQMRSLQSKEIDKQEKEV